MIELLAEGISGPQVGVFFETDVEVTIDIAVGKLDLQDLTFRIVAN